MLASALKLHLEVQEALATGRPVVALESTVLTHGLPQPQNLAVAREVEAAIRAEGAVPATIAILDGQALVGLSPDELSRLAQESQALKASRRDLGVALASGRPASTTVAGTMVLAHLAGIQVFATGGLGGAHRGAQHSFDLSADLSELARTPVLVVCAGVKSLLDAALTMELLETAGVPVLGYRTDRLPGFYTADAGLGLPHRVEEAAQVAAIAQAHWALGLAGLVLAQPLPAEAAADGATMEAAIQEALAAAEAQGVRGAAITPFILGRLNQGTGGASLRANVALLLANARLAAQVACALKA